MLSQRLGRLVVITNIIYRQEHSSVAMFDAAAASARQHALAGPVVHRRGGVAVVQAPGHFPKQGQQMVGHVICSSMIDRRLVICGLRWPEKRPLMP